MHAFTIAVTLLAACQLLSSPARAQDPSQLEECLGNVMPKPRYGIAKGTDPLSVSETTEDGQQSCAQACCNSIESCNVALFEHNDADGKYYCTLLSCQPLSSCMFVPNQFSSYSYIVELRTANKTESELKLEEEEVREEQKVEALLNGEDPPPPETATVNISALAEEADEEMYDEFQQMFRNDTWNLGTEQPGSNVSDQENAGDDVQSEDAAIDDWNAWLNDDDDQESTTTFADVTDAGPGLSTAAIKRPHGAGETNNGGVWGPHNVKDIDYEENEMAPFIVLGVVATIVFVLMVLIFVAKKLSLESERTKYRPLNESFPSSTPYHDKTGDAAGGYHDIE